MDDLSIVSDISTLLVSNDFLSEDQRKTKKHLRHIIKLGLAFTLIVFFPISGCLQETILKAYEEKSGVRISAYLSQAIQCISGAFACLYTPVFLAWAQPKPTFIVAGCIHLFYTTSYILPNAYSIYIISGLLGAAGSMIWMTHGITVVHNSTEKTLSRNYSVFFIMFQISFLASNTYIYVSYGSIDDYINETMLIMMGLGFLGIMILPFISVPRASAGQVAQPAEMAVASAKIIRKPIFWKMMPLTIYLGFESSFIFGAFPSAVSSLLALGGNPHQLVGLVGLLMSCGKVFAGIISIKLSKSISLIAMIGMVSHCAAYYISFLYIPTEAITQDTWVQAYLPPDIVPLGVASFFFGIGDVLLFTSGFSLLGFMFRGRTFATAVSMFNFVVLSSTGFLFGISGYLAIEWQLLIAVSTLLVGIPALFQLDRELKQNPSTEPAEDQVQ